LFYDILEVLHRLFHQCQAAGALHAPGEGQFQVQALAGGCLHPIRVLHHVPHCTQHHPPHDEGKQVSILPTSACSML
jgi:hypothetical protein